MLAAVEPGASGAIAADILGAASPRAFYDSVRDWGHGCKVVGLLQARDKSWTGDSSPNSVLVSALAFGHFLVSSCIVAAHLVEWW